MKNVLLLALMSFSIWSCGSEGQPIGDPEIASTELKTVTNSVNAIKSDVIEAVDKEPKEIVVQDEIVQQSKEVPVKTTRPQKVVDKKIEEVKEKITSIKTPKTEVKEDVVEAINSVEEATIVEVPVVEVEKPVRNTPPDHAKFSEILSKNVSSKGNVNYAAVLKNRAALDAYTSSLSSNPPHKDWTAKETEAYWVNVYNAYTLTKIINNYPLKSITDLDNGKPWDYKWIKIGGKTYSLNQIENEILRPTYKDPEIHFMVNCAAKSCPPLANKAWTAYNLESLGKAKAKAFINDTRFNEISADEIKISKIFEWYGEDFGNIIDYLNKFSNVKINPDAKISYKEYDWNLNK